MSGSIILEEPVCLSPSGDRCGEGVTWHAVEQAIYWVDINRFLLHRYSLGQKTTESWFFDEPVTSVVQTSDEAVMLVVLASKLILWRRDSNKRVLLPFLLPGYPQVRFNDARVDPGGALWVGSMRNNVAIDGSALPAGGTDGILFRFDPDYRVSEWARGIGIANTLAWSPDHRTFYFADTLANRICAHDYDITRAHIARERTFFEGFGRGLPDGSTVDSEGYIWNCRYGGSCVVRIDPQGNVDHILEMPTASPTACTFGGPEGDVLFITSASLESAPSDRLAGSVFAVKTSVHGLGENRFQLL